MYAQHHSSTTAIPFASQATIQRMSEEIFMQHGKQIDESRSGRGHNKGYFFKFWSTKSSKFIGDIIIIVTNEGENKNLSRL